jgi:ketosteroid isomerase-like protein
MHLEPSYVEEEQEKVMQSNIDIVRGIYDSIQRGDLNAVLANFADDCTIELMGPPTIPFAGSYRGPSGMQDFIEKYMQTTDMLDFGPDELHGDGDFVTVLAHEHARSKQTGREWTTPLVDTYVVHDGKVQKFVCSYDTAAVSDAFTERAAA